MKRFVAPAYLLLTPFFIFISVCGVRATASPFFRLNNVDEGETEVKNAPPKPSGNEDNADTLDIELNPEMDTTIFDNAADTEGSPEVDGSDSGGKNTGTEPVDSPGKEIKSDTETEIDSGSIGNSPADTEKIIYPGEESEKTAPPEKNREKETKTENALEEGKNSENYSSTEEEETEEGKNSSGAEEEKNSRAEVPPLPGPLLKEHVSVPEYISTTPETQRGILASDFDTGRQKLLTAGELTGPPAAGGSYFSWKYLAGGGILVLFVFIVWWKRRPRKVNIYHDETSTKAEDYFKNHFTRHTALTNGGSDWREKSSSTSSSNSSRRKARPIWKYDDKKLRKLGVDPKYREALRLYYSRGLPLERIARETGLGKGEIGLVIDLTKRLREEAV